MIRVFSSGSPHDRRRATRRRAGRRIQFDSLEGRTLLSVGLVKDINQVDSNPIDLTNVNGALYFVANVPTGGEELWKSDGTAAGTTKLAQFGPAYSSTGFDLTGVNGTLYFVAPDSQHVEQLWKSDGTAAGSVQLTNATSYFLASALTDVNGMLYFVGTDSTHGTQLWKSDGTAAGTAPVTSVSTSGTSGSFSPQSLTGVNGTLYFTAFDSSFNNQLWKVDPSAASGAVQLTNFASAAYFGASNLTDFNGTLYFTGPAGTTYWSTLYKSDGTPGGTVAINPASVFGVTGNLTAVGNALYFVGVSSNDTQVFKSDGTAAGTNPITSTMFTGTPQNLTDVNGTLYFTANDGTHGQELWKSDGTPGGTGLVKDIRSGPVGSVPSLVSTVSSTGTTTGPSFQIVGVNGTAYFAADDGSDGQELWKSDGTPGGTVMVEDLNPGADSSSPRQLTAFNDKIAFVAHDGSGANQVWVSDGTAGGTVAVKSFTPAQTADAIDWFSVPTFGVTASRPLAIVNGKIYFAADDGVHGRELWSSDGTAAGTTLVDDIVPGPDSSSPADFTNFNGTLYFRASTQTSSGLWKSDGTPGGTVQVFSSYLVPGSLVNDNGTLYFATSSYNSSKGYSTLDLYKSDGTAPETTKVTTIDAGSSIFQLFAPTPIGGTLYFLTFGAGTGSTELWKTDGTAAGTVELKTLPSLPTSLVAFGGDLYFLEPDSSAPGSGVTLYQSDGTPGGTVAVKDFPSRNGLVASNLTASGGSLFLVADDGTNGYQLYKTDGTAAGTVPLTTFTGGFGSVGVGSLADVNGTLFFTESDPSQGTTLWKSDGTTAGTTMVAALGSAVSVTNAINDSGTLIFIGTSYSFDPISLTSSASRNFYKSDGTAAGTVKLDSIPIPISNFIFNVGLSTLTLVNGTLAFANNDGIHGYELWTATNLSPATQLTLAPIADQTVAQGTMLTLTATATDTDPARTLTYNLDPGAPSGATIDAKTGAFTWAVPAAQAPSDYPVTVRATDDGSPPLSDAKTFTIHVNAATPANQPPSLAAIPNQTVAQGSTVTLIVTATDPDVGQTLTYSLDPGAPSDATIDAKTGAFTWAVPAAQAPGDYPVTVRATDNGLPPLSDAKTFTIHVNAAPTPTPPPVQVLTPYQRNAIFARALYRNILGHDPNQANLTSWVNRLLAGTSAGQMATTLWNSAEHRTLVRRHKAPALSYNSALSFALQASQPMSMRHQDTVFVTTFCRDVLGHNPPPAVLNSWVKRMLVGTSQNQVATAIWNSAEHRTLVKRHRAPQISYSSALADASQAASNA